MKFYVEYSGYTTVDAKNEDEAIGRAMEDGLLDLDFSVYTPSQWQNKNKKKGKSQ